jgi:hypothetical protein
MEAGEKRIKEQKKGKKARMMEVKK